MISKFRSVSPVHLWVRGIVGLAAGTFGLLLFAGGGGGALLGLLSMSAIYLMMKRYEREQIEALQIVSRRERKNAERERASVRETQGSAGVHLTSSRSSRSSAPAEVSGPPLRPEHLDSVRSLPLLFDASHGNERRSRSPDEFWVPEGQEIRLHDFIIPGGMIYVGQGLRALEEQRRGEPALIQPSLSVRVEDTKVWSKELDEWRLFLTYERLSERDRAFYLQWLAGGRCDPSAPIACVFLFFFGLERRLLFDTRTSERAQKEIPALIAEIERLLGIYGEEPQFSRYARELLALSRLCFLQQLVIEETPPPMSPDGGFSLELLVGLGARLASRVPIQGPWAFSWFIQHPLVFLRTPARRCPAEFERLFLLRFEQMYPQGLLIQPNKTKLNLIYEPANRGLPRYHFDSSVELPDVRVLQRPMRKFAEIAESGMAELESYSRFLGRNPDARGTAQALSLLPAELLPLMGGDVLDSFRKLLESKLSDQQFALIHASELLSLWSPGGFQKLQKKSAIDLSIFLEKLGFALEPDVRFGSPAINPQGKIVLFRLQERSQRFPLSQEYEAAMVLLRLAASVAIADGNVSPEEKEHLVAHLERLLKLDGGEKARLSAHLSWLLEEQPGMGGLKKRLESLSPVTKRQIATFTTSIAGADGYMSPTEIRILERIYKMLDISNEEVFADIHALTSSPATVPVVVARAQPAVTGRAIPDPPREVASQRRDKPDQVQVPGSLALDMDLVQAKMQDTAEVASLLANIFEEEEAPLPPAQVPPTTELSFVDLDAAHTQLLQALQAKGTELTLAQFEELCLERDLLPDAAFDQLNEAAFELCDAPLLVDGDPIDVDWSVMQEMCS